jgi:predicted anti-sigma-YlaC factor YlaD
MTPPPLQITCKEFVELVTSHLDGTLTDEDRIRFECHSERCPGCRAYLKQFCLTLDALSSVHTDAVEPENLARLVRAFKDSRPPAES